MKKISLFIFVISALSFGSSPSFSLSKFNPTLVAEPGNDRQHLFASVADAVGRLEWSPSGWGGTWMLHPNNSTGPTRVWRENFTSLSWFDINARPTGLAGGPQIENFVGYVKPSGQRQVARFRLAGDYGLGYTWSLYWGVDVPPDTSSQNLNPNPGIQSFYPQDGYVHYDNGIYRRHVFGHTYEIVPDANNQLREYAWSGNSWWWRDHGLPTLSTGAMPAGISFGPNSVEHNWSGDETWVFVATNETTSPTTLPELFVRHFDATSPTGRWENLGAPYQNSANIRALRFRAPVSVAYEQGGNQIIHVYTVIARDSAPFTSPSNTCCVTWELWERKFSGAQWEAWNNHGTLPGAMPSDINAFQDALTLSSAVSWLENGQRQITLFANRSGTGEVVTLECSANNCVGPTVIGLPSLNGVPTRLYANTAFVHNTGFTYISHVGRTSNGSVVELYRDSRQVGATWSWRTLYQAPGTATDWDNDGIEDFDELNLAAQDPAQFACLDPYDNDSDGDGLGDAEEMNVHGTSPCSNDTDGDAMPDLYEVHPDNVCLSPLVADYFDDPDGDTLSNGAERSMGTKPCDAFSDADKFDDANDNCPRINNPTQDDLDGDDIGDVCDGDRDGDACPNFLDPTPDDIANPTRTCFLRLQDDIAAELELLDARLNDARLRDMIDGLVPRLPDGGIDCLSCPPFKLIRFNAKTGEVFAAIKLEHYGLDESAGKVYTAILLPDLDGDGFSDFAIGLPLATIAKKRVHAGLVLIVSGDTGRELARIEGLYAKQGLGESLRYFSDGYLEMRSASAEEKQSHRDILRLDSIGIVKPYGDEFNKEVIDKKYLK